MQNDNHSPNTKPFQSTTSTPPGQRHQPTSPEQFAKDWLAHVDAGRIGKRPKMKPEHLRTHVRNEILLRGLIY